MRLLLPAVLVLALLCCGCPQPKSDAPDSAPAAGGAGAADASASADAPAAGFPEPASLREELLQIDQQTAGSPEVGQFFSQANQRLRESGAITGGGLQAAPVFTLKDQTGADFASGVAAAQGRILVVQFYRGEWCPYCNAQLKWLQASLPQFEAAGATVVAVTPEAPEHVKTIADKLGLTFPVLHDAGSAVARRYGVGYAVEPEVAAKLSEFGVDVAQRNAAEEAWLPVPATFIVDPQGNVAWSWVETDFTKRAEPAEVLTIVQSLRGKLDSGVTLGG